MANFGSRKKGKDKLISNRFAGSDAVYQTKKYLVREDVSTGKNNVIKTEKRYLSKSQSERIKKFAKYDCNSDKYKKKSRR